MATTDSSRTLPSVWRTLTLLIIAVLVAGVAMVPGATRAQEAPPTTLISPIAGGWTLLVNLADAAPPAEAFDGLEPWLSAAFTYDATSDRFRSYRPALPALSDLSSVAAGEAFWLFVPTDRLNGDLTFWQQSASVGARTVTLQPGFNLSGWTGSNGLTISEATAGLPLRRAYLWEPLTQRFRIWDSTLPFALRDDFALEYGAGFWIDIAGSAAVAWEQS